MKIPSEAIIEAVVSDLKTHSAEDVCSTKKEHAEQCDFCQLIDEMNLRQKKAPEGHNCQLGEIVVSMTLDNPLAQIPPIQSTIQGLAAMCFLVGLKSRAAMDELSKMEELFSKEAPEE